MMRVAVMQPYIFPYIGYVQLMGAVDRFVFLDDVAYINKGWINRNRILVNGAEHLFTLPLAGASQNRPINSIQLLNDGKWKAKFLRTIEMAYKKAPEFSNVFPLIASIINFEEERVHKYIANSFAALNGYLGIKTVLSSATDFEISGDIKAEERIIAICERAGCTAYINPIGGTELYSAASFRSKGMTLQFLKSDQIVYSQGKTEFVPWLSVIDVLMWNGVPEVQNILTRYELITGKENG